jgi:hypothetical protein
MARRTWLFTGVSGRVIDEPAPGTRAAPSFRPKPTVRDEVEELAGEQAALRRVATLVAKGADPGKASPVAYGGRLLTSPVRKIQEMHISLIGLAVAMGRDAAAAQVAELG